MHGEHKPLKSAAGLRQRAEAALLEQAVQSPEKPGALSEEQTRLTLHELRVHQIELEMQNEDLRHSGLELEAARARYFDLYDLAPVGYCTLSEPGVVLQANFTAANLLGGSRSQLVHLHISDFIFKEDQTVFYLMRKKVFETGEAQACELRMVKKDKTVFWAHLMLALAHSDKLAPELRVVLTDISERKAAEALRISEHRLRLLADSARDVIWNMVPEGTITYISPSVEAVRGYTPAEAMQQTIVETLTPESLATAVGYFTQVQADMKAGRPPQSFRGELEYRCKDGSTFWGEVMAHPLVDAEGHIQILGVTRDIIEHKRRKIELENEARRLTSQIAQMDRQRSLGEMSASLSHELNQPLTAILTNAQVGQRGLKAGRFETERIGEFFDKIIFNARRAGEIIDRIRSFIRPAEIEQIPVDLQRLAGDILDLVGPEATEHKVDIIFSPYTSPMWVKGDATQLSQVLMNIYRNAIEAMRESELREIHVQLMPFGDRLNLSICDTGPGLAPEMLQKAGTPFLTTKAGGLGLGLSIARSIIAQHRGTLSVGRAGGGGACVDIDLPLLPASAKARS